MAKFTRWANVDGRDLDYEEEVPRRKIYHVSIAMPYYREGLAWTVSMDFDSLSADTLGTLGGVKVPIEDIEAKDEKEAISKFKKMHPEFKKHYRKMDKEDIELSI